MFYVSNNSENRRVIVKIWQFVTVYMGRKCSLTINALSLREIVSYNHNRLEKSSTGYILSLFCSQEIHQRSGSSSTIRTNENQNQLRRIFVCFWTRTAHESVEKLFFFLFFLILISRPHSWRFWFNCWQCVCVCVGGWPSPLVLRKACRCFSCTNGMEIPWARLSSLNSQWAASIDSLFVGPMSG